MLARVLSAGENDIMTGVDGVAQFVGRDQGALFLATQMRDCGWIPRAMAAVEKLEETRDARVMWPSLDDS
jgi:hypothetical protein